MVKVKLINYTKDGMHLISSMAKATRQNELDEAWLDNDIYKKIKLTFHSDEAFVKQLIKIGHLGVLEHITFTFHISEISRCCSHQLVRHRIASYLQMSNRHTKPNREDYVIPTSIRKTKYENVANAYADSINDSYSKYGKLIDMDVPIEDARYVLPPAFFTHISMTMNLRQILHFLELRLTKDAQHEIRELACKIFDICYEKYPVCLESVKELRNENEL